MEPPRFPSLAEVAHEGERHVPALDPESLNHYRHLTAYHFALGLARGADVLDYGCGTGYGLNLVGRRGARTITGVDTSEDAIRFCRVSYGDLADRFRRVSPGELPFADCSFDLVLLFQVIEHVGDDAGLLWDLRRVLRPGGRLLVTTPNVEFTGSDPDNPDNPHHVREYDRSRLRATCRPVFDIVQELGVHGSFRAGGAGFGPERSLFFRGARRLLRLLRKPPYNPPISLADFGIRSRRIERALDLLFLCTRLT